MIEIIVVNYNSHTWLQRFLKSIEETTPEGDYQMIVVDNGSTEKDNFEYLEEVKKKHKVLLLPENIGYGQAIMEAYRVYQQEDIFIFASSDIEMLSPKWIEPLLEPFKDEKVGLVGPKFVLSNGNLGGTGFIGKEDAPIIRGWNVLDKGQYRETEEVIAVCGAFTVVRREAFEKVGGFDSIFELYYEDIDLSYQMRNKGYKVVFCPDVEVLHYFNKTPDIEKRQRYVRSLALFTLKYNCSREWSYNQVKGTKYEERLLKELLETGKK